MEPCKVKNKWEAWGEEWGGGLSPWRDFFRKGILGLKFRGREEFLFCLFLVRFQSLYIESRNV